jgi:hypothetical protein
VDADFRNQIGVMALVFVLAVVSALPSRRMSRGDHRTFLVLVTATLVVSVLPGVLAWGLTRNAATYMLGAALIVLAATLNRSARRGAD